MGPTRQSCAGAVLEELQPMASICRSVWEGLHCRKDPCLVELKPYGLAIAPFLVLLGHVRGGGRGGWEGVFTFL